MPLMPDTRIPLSGIGSGSQQPTAMETLGGMMRIKELQGEFQKRAQERELQRRDLEDDDAIRSTLPKYERPDEAIQELYHQGRATAAAKLGTAMYNQRKAQLADYNEQLTSTGKRLEQATQIMQGVNDDASLKTASPALRALLEPVFGDGVMEQIGTKFDPEHKKAVLAWGTKRSEQIQQEHNAAGDLMNAFDKGAISNPYAPNEDGTPSALQTPAGVEAGPRYSKAAQGVWDGYFNAASKTLGNAQNKKQWDTYLEQLHAMGAPDHLLKMIPQWNDANPDASRQAARQLGLSEKEKQDVRHDKLMEENDQTRAKTALARAETAKLVAERGGGATSSAAASRPITETKQAELREKRDSANKALETWIRQTSDGQRTANKDEPFKLEQLTDKGKSEYVRQRLQIENDYRGTMNLPSLEDAAAAAAKNGDLDSYNIVKKKYEAITQKLGPLGTLDKVVPPPDPGSAKGRQKRIDELEAEFNTTKDTKRRHEIQAEVARLGKFMAAR